MHGGSLFQIHKINLLTEHISGTLATWKPESKHTGFCLVPFPFLLLSFPQWLFQLIGYQSWRPASEGGYAIDTSGNSLILLLHPVTISHWSCFMSSLTLWYCSHAQPGRHTENLITRELFILCGLTAFRVALLQTGFSAIKENLLNSKTPNHSFVQLLFMAPFLFLIRSQAKIPTRPLMLWPLTTFKPSCLFLNHPHAPAIYLHPYPTPQSFSVFWPCWQIYTLLSKSKPLRSCFLKCYTHLRRMISKQLSLREPSLSWKWVSFPSSVFPQNTGSYNNQTLFFWMEWW